MMKPEGDEAAPSGKVIGKPDWINIIAYIKISSKYDANTQEAVTQ